MRIGEGYLWRELFRQLQRKFRHFADLLDYYAYILAKTEEIPQAVPLTLVSKTSGV